MAKLRRRAQQDASGPIVEDLDWFVFRKQPRPISRRAAATS